MKYNALQHPGERGLVHDCDWSDAVNPASFVCTRSYPHGETLGCVCVCVCRTQCVQVSLLVGEVGPEVGVGFLGVLLFILSSFWVLVPEDEVQFVILATLVGSEHDGVWSLVLKLLLRRMEGREHSNFRYASFL